VRGGRGERERLVQQGSTYTVLNVQLKKEETLFQEEGATGRSDGEEGGCPHELI